MSFTITPKTNWLSTDRYNFVDLNRVENNTHELVTYLASIGYTIASLTYDTGRVITSIDYLTSINRVESNIETIKDGFITPPDWEETKTWTVDLTFNYEDANRLEVSLDQLLNLGVLVYDSFKYCGTFYSGEDGLIY
jgi:hypothetical protein